MGTTPNYAWEYPDVGADVDTWGAISNALFVAVDAQVKIVSDAQVADAAKLTARTGAVDYFPFSAAPTGYVKANGGTIGNAASGGTTRANADTSPLFVLLWANLDNTNYPIQDSAGTPTTRGATAAADYAANKRFPLPDLRAEFVRGLDDGRGVDTGRVLGTGQTDEFEAHTHAYGGSMYLAGFGSGFTGTSGLATGSPVTATNSTGSTETRPRNVALLACMRL
jgi:phage-related tail fiber protein